MPRPSSQAPAKPEAARVWWRCTWCGAGGSVQVQYPNNATDVEKIFLLRKQVERGHERSLWCHVVRYLLHVEVSEKGPVPK